MDAAWRDEAKFHLVGDRQEELTVKQADFSGAVDVKAPQGKVKSEKLKLFFDPSAAPRDADKGKRRAPAATQPFGNGRQPVLRRVVASEKVFCELADAPCVVQQVAKHIKFKFLVWHSN